MHEGDGAAAADHQPICPQRGKPRPLGLDSEEKGLQTRGSVQSLRKRRPQGKEGVGLAVNPAQEMTHPAQNSGTALNPRRAISAA